MNSNKVLNGLTVLVNPLLMPTIGVFLIFNSGSLLDFTLPEVKKSVYLIVFLGTFILPLCFIPFFLYNNIIKSVLMTERKERIIPFAIATIIYALVFIAVYRIPVALILKKFVLATALSVLLITIINYLWKISAHLAGLGGILGLLFAVSIRLNIDLISYIIITILLSGIIGFCRLKLNAHTPLQVYSGFILGMCCVFFTVMYF